MPFKHTREQFGTMYCLKASEIDLNKEYSPSWCANRFQDDPNPRAKVVENFVEVLTEETQRVRNKYKVIANVKYGNRNSPNNTNNRLDIYYKDTEFGTPIFVFIHGGYWQSLDNSSSGSFVGPYVERGYRVINVDYNLCPNVTLEQLVVETEEFFGWLANYAEKTKATKIDLSGHSAGAHLLALLFSDRIPATLFSPSIPIKNIDLISGVYDLRELWHLQSVNEKDILSLDAKTSEKLSPILWPIRESTVERLQMWQTKVHLLVGGNESDTFINQSKEYAAKIRRAGLEGTCLFKVFEEYDHFNIIEEVSQTGTAINRYLMENSN